MKLNYYFKLLFATLISLTTLSCDKDSATDDLVDDSKAVFEVEITGDMNESLVANIVVNDYDQIYVAGIIEESLYQSEMGGDAEDYAYYLIDFVQATGSVLSKVDNEYIFKGNSTVDIKNTWALSYETDYIFAVFGVDSDGVITTDIITTEYTSQDAPITPFDLQIDGASIDDLAVDVTVDSDYSANYIVGVVTVDYFESSLASKESLLPSLVLGYVAALTDGSYDLSTGYVYNGSQRVDLASLWSLEPNTEYVVVAFGLTTFSDGVTDDIIYPDELTVETLFVTTDSTVDASMNITLADTPDHSGFNVNVEKGSSVDFYYVALMTQSKFASTYGSDADAAASNYLSTEYADTEIEDFTLFEGAIPVFSTSGEVNLRSFYAYLFEPSTDYVALAFGIDASGDVTSDVAQFSASTTAAPFYDSATFDIDTVGEVTASNFVVSVSPSDDTFNYLVCAFEKSNFDSESGIYIDATTKEPDYVAAAQSWVTNLADWYYEDENQEAVHADFNVADGVTVFNGDAPAIDIQFTRNTAIKSSTEYVVLAFGISSPSTIVTNISTLDVTVADPAQVEIEFTFEEVTPMTASDYGYEGSVRVIPSDFGISYFASVLPVSYVDGYTDQEVYDNNNLGMIAPYMSYKGVYLYEYSFIYEDSYIVVFGYEGGMTTAIATYRLEVPAE